MRTLVDLFDVDASIQKSNICFREYCRTKDPHKQSIRRGYLMKRLSLRSRQFISRKWSLHGIHRFSSLKRTCQEKKEGTSNYTDDRLSINRITPQCIECYDEIFPDRKLLHYGSLPRRPRQLEGREISHDVIEDSDYPRASPNVSNFISASSFFKGWSVIRRIIVPFD